MSQQPSTVSASKLVAAYQDLLRLKPELPVLAAVPVSANLPKRDSAKPCVLLFSPHPDDEALTGALPFRLQQEQNWHIINIALTLGSDPARRAARQQELANACALLGFACALPQPDGFTVHASSPDDPSPAAVSRLSEIIAHYQPQAIFLPHANDAHPTHIAAHHLGLKALAAQPTSFACSVVETEFWQPHAEPNLMIGLSAKDVARLVASLACHEGENARNPYAARLPATLIDNVRRGSERIAGKGTAAAPIDFAMLYRIGLWRAGRFVPSALKRTIPADADIATLFD